MFERFLTAYHLTPADQQPPAAWHDERLLAATGYAEFAARFAGCTFDDGLYRIHDATSGPAAYDLVVGAFPKLAGRVSPFAYDWYGRQFAVDLARTRNDEPLLLLADVTTAGVFQVPHAFVPFHDVMLVDDSEEAVGREYFREWARANPAAVPLRPDQCVSPRIPLSLGGSDDIDALEVSDLSVHWTLHGQFWQQTRDLPEGTRIRKTTL
ncbi:MAG: hypothetical protein AUI14_16755 [Actinobacteria bacterium 13_2_20CM_2_71_6]|nr:MAG: hypothetical protein AUI14_16755 [Actinobacteria bacterium 13_2_20CM_2_71_6]